MTACSLEMPRRRAGRLCDSYERFMQTHHIPAVLQTGAFKGAAFTRSAPGRYQIRYDALSRQALDEYLAKHTSLVRAEFTSNSRKEWS